MARRRKDIAQRAELLGAVRLPNNAFKANAGTEVTSDIIFLQKRDRLADIQPDWVHLGLTVGGIPVNSYFADNPHMVLGEMAYDEMMYGSKSETACNPIDGADLAEQLEAALSHIQGILSGLRVLPAMLPESHRRGRGTRAQVGHVHQEDDQAK